MGTIETRSDEYGFHRDELYFIVVGSQPALGYVDQWARGCSRCTRGTTASQTSDPREGERDVVILVGWWSTPWWSGTLAGCQPVARIGNAHGMPIQEQGAGVAVCTTLRPWSEVWDRIRHLD